MVFLSIRRVEPSRQSWSLDLRKYAKYANATEAYVMSIPSSLIRRSPSEPAELEPVQLRNIDGGDEGGMEERRG